MALEVVRPGILPDAGGSDSVASPSMEIPPALHFQGGVTPELERTLERMNALVEGVGLMSTLTDRLIDPELQSEVIAKAPGAKELLWEWTHTSLATPEAERQLATAIEPLFEVAMWLQHEYHTPTLRSNFASVRGKERQIAVFPVQDLQTHEDLTHFSLILTESINKCYEAACTLKQALKPDWKQATQLQLGTAMLLDTMSFAREIFGFLPPLGEMIDSTVMRKVIGKEVASPLGIPMTFIDELPLYPIAVRYPKELIRSFLVHLRELYMTTESQIWS